MSDLVIDASVATAWCMPDERRAFSNAVLLAIQGGSVAAATRLLAYEIRNSILMGLRRKRVQENEIEDFLASFTTLKIRLLDPLSYDDVFDLAEQHGLTFYDAAYLDLAVRQKLPLASLDKQLCKVAEQLAVKLFVP